MLLKSLNAQWQWVTILGGTGVFDGQLESEPLKYHPTFANSTFSRVLLMSFNAQLQWVVRIIQIANSL